MLPLGSLSPSRAWFEALPVPSREWCSLLHPTQGYGGDPGQIPRPVVREDTQISSTLTNWALLGFAEQEGLWSPTELQRHHQQAQVTLQGWHIPQIPVQRTC